MRKLTITAMALLFTVPALMAQDDHDERNDKVESLKIAFITEKLNLSSKEATVFWPVFNEYNDQVKKIRARQKENIAQLKAKASPTDAESERFISDQLALKQAEIDLMKKYVTEFKKVLPQPKIARLLTLEQEFKQQLLQRLKQRHDRMGR